MYIYIYISFRSNQEDPHADPGVAEAAEEKRTPMCRGPAVIKNEDLHKSIVAVCKGINAKLAVLALLNGLLLGDSDDQTPVTDVENDSDDQTPVTDVETGLQRLASRLKSGPPLPSFTDLDMVKAKQHLFALAGNDRFATLLKTPSEISSKYSLCTVDLDFDSDVP